MRVLVIVGAVIGAVILALTFLVPKGAPQEAAMAAMACAFAVIPYVLFRAGQLASADADRKAFQKAVLDRLDRLDGRSDTP